jgi:hypothetical protein
VGVKLEIDKGVKEEAAQSEHEKEKEESDAAA